MTPTLTEQDVVRIIKTYNTQQGGTTGAFTIPLHIHSGSGGDAPKVIMGDLSYDARGFNFPIAYGNISFQVTSSNPSTGTINDVTVIPPFDTFGNILDTNFYFGQAPNYFNKMGINVRDRFEVLVGYDFSVAPTYTVYTELDDHIDINSTAPINGTGWYMRLPVNDFSNMPPTPVLGDVCYASADGGLTGNLYVCESPGVWTPK